MLFNSIEFVIFLPLVLLLYWTVFNKTVQLRNAFLLVASYCFYGFWDYRFLFLIALTSTIDFYCGLKIEKSSEKSTRKTFLFVSLFSNLGILGFFKYYDFFIQELIDLFSQFGISANFHTLRIILPVGISFYTFQTLSYTIDVYKRKIKPTKDIISFFTFVSFFPQLVAGPIERAGNLLPQFKTLKKFDYKSSAEGFRRILWGLFAKIVIADSVAPIVDRIFGNIDSLNGISLVLGAVLFTVQIYCDFSGYSNIAIGTARLMGFNLLENFKTPFFSLNIKEFWTRWHISLSTWFRDYVYIFLGGNRKGEFRHMINIIITFTVSGLWHGANWTFICWGTLHGLFYLLLLPLAKCNNKSYFTKLTSRIFTFALVCFAFIFFRSADISEAFSYVKGFFNSGNVSLFEIMNLKDIALGLLFSGIFFAIEWCQRNQSFGLDIENKPFEVRYISYIAILFLILFTFQGGNSFIYFQF